MSHKSEQVTRREREIMNALFALGNRASAEQIRARLSNPPTDSSVRVMLARLDPEQVGDEMLPTVGWSWLTEALEQNGAAHVALGGTVTQTSSVRFGDIAGPRRDDDVELRASWTPVGGDGSGVDLRCHAEAFCTLVSTAAGLPPVGIAQLTR